MSQKHFNYVIWEKVHRLWRTRNQWRDFLDNEWEWNEQSLKGGQTWPLYQQLYPFLANQPSGFDRKEYDKTARMIDRLKLTVFLLSAKTKRVKRQELDEIATCGHCKVNGSSIPHGLRVCSACRNEKYCSTECQKLAWKEHKAVCKASRKDDPGN
ncbi:hypothetical protein C8F04DRAFT_1198096 [Mycena alexandri]|uniref:MYND-type domain-containing protein n=1 Tax=Mycena alexandri TaxID=1745969 RepID=A0AAD6S2I3_9AGAR|nr:hypothetical protein C8F04DRAFT_1198096 [Mycena alexandri]